MTSSKYRYLQGTATLTTGKIRLSVCLKVCHMTYPPRSPYIGGVMKKRSKILKNFAHEGQKWTINFIDEEPNTDYGNTHHDANEINIWCKNMPDSLVKETLQHEILHIVLRDCMNVMNALNVSAYDKEECLIRMISPRLFSIYKENPILREYIYGK